MKSYNIVLGCWVPSGLAGKNSRLGKLGWATFNENEDQETNSSFLL